MKLGFASGLTMAAAVCLGGAAPYATMRPALPHSPAARRAAADQLRRTWLAHHPDESDATMTPPKILSGTVTTSNVDATSTAAASEVEIKFSADKSGIDYASLQFTGSGGGSIVIYYDPGNFPSAGTVKVSDASVNLYRPAGTYTLVSAFIVSNDGMSTYYTPSQISKLFSVDSFQLINPNPGDVTPPTIASGKIVTKTVSLGSAKPAIVIDLSVADDVSGVNYCYAGILDPSGNISYGAYGAAPTPIVASATLPIGFDFDDFYTSPVTGTYTITYIDCQDVAGNYTEIDGATAIKALLGSDTLKVTN